MSRLIVIFIVVSACATTQGADSFVVARDAAMVFDRYCIVCDGSETSEADVRFDVLPKPDRDARLAASHAASPRFEAIGTGR